MPDEQLNDLPDDTVQPFRAPNERHSGSGDSGLNQAVSNQSSGLANESATAGPSSDDGDTDDGDTAPKRTERVSQQSSSDQASNHSPVLDTPAASDADWNRVSGQRWLDNNLGPIAGPQYIEVPSIKVLPAVNAGMPSVRSTAPRRPSAGSHSANGRADLPEEIARPHQAVNSGAVSSDNDALRILLQASAAAESLQQRFAELNQQRAEIAAEHHQLNADRQAFENRARQFAEQVAADRTAQRELQAELQQRINKVAAQEETIERQTTELRTAQRALSDERVLLKQALKAELEEERSRIEQQAKLLEAERNQVQQRNEHDRLEHAERMRQLDAELDQERQRLVDKVRAEMAAELAQLNREKQEWRETREQQKQEAQQQAEELQQQREAFGEQLQAEQSRLRDEVEKRRQMLLTEQSNLQRRYRFQFEHLGRAREDLEFEVRELRREQQLFRTERQRFSEQHRLRFRQLEKVRKLLADAEASLMRETRIIERSRAAAQSDIQRQQRRAEEEREAILQDIDNRQRRVRQQELSLADLASRLDERSQRLGSLRAELDKTQGEILEQRLAVEEARTSLFKDTAQSDTARARLEQARGDVQSFFDRLKTQINVERDKIELASADISERQAQFRRDRSELEQWFIDREAAMNARTTESIVLELQQTIEQQQAELHELQERWKADRREAERTIRELLDQLTTAEIRALNSPVPAVATQQNATPASNGSSSPSTADQHEITGPHDITGQREAA